MACQPVLGLSTPPLRARPHALTRHVDLQPVPSSVAAARSFVRETLEATDTDAEARQTALLLVSELVTNAILHARTELHLGVIVDEGQALVCVADRAADSPELFPRERSQTRPGGRGLALVDELSDRWGTTRYSGGKTVWFLLPVASRPLRVG